MNAMKLNALTPAEDSDITDSIKSGVIVIEGYNYPVVPNVLSQDVFNSLPPIAKHALLYGFKKKLVDAVAGKGDAKGYTKERRAEVIGKVYRRLTEEKVWNKGAFGEVGRKAKTIADKALDLGLEFTEQERAFLAKLAQAEEGRKAAAKKAKAAAK